MPLSKFYTKKKDRTKCDICREISLTAHAGAVIFVFVANRLDIFCDIFCEEARWFWKNSADSGADDEPPI